MMNRRPHVHFKHSSLTIVGTNLLSPDTSSFINFGLSIRRILLQELLVLRAIGYSDIPSSPLSTIFPSPKNSEYH